MTRIGRIEAITEAYFKLIRLIDWEDKLFVAGIKEGLRKFLSNSYLSLCRGHKYLSGDYYSHGALETIKTRQYVGLVFEHMVPKEKYIQSKIVEKAKAGNLEKEYIQSLLLDYWWIAIVTKDEHQKLNSRNMPEGWDGREIKARYQVAGIDLVPRDVVFEQLILIENLST